MTACPRCGSANADGAATCATCGHALAPPAARARFKQTMLGGVSPTPIPPTGEPGPAAQQQRPLGGTMVGMAPNAEPPHPPARPLGGTMVGMAPAASSHHIDPTPPTATSPGAGPPGLGHTVPVGSVHGAPAFPQTQPSPQGVGSAASGREGAAGLKQTMLGMAPPNLSAGAPFKATAPPAADEPFDALQTLASGSNAPPGISEASRPPEPVAHQPTPAPPAAPAAGPVVSKHRTMLGVAMPGIAPINPGAPKPSARPEPPVAAVAAPPPRSQGIARPATPAEVVAKPKVPKGALVLIGVALLLLAGGGVIWFFWHAPDPMRAEITLDENGKERLTVECDNCPDGTVVRLDGETATVNGGRVSVPLESGVKVGENVFRLGVERPGMGRDEQIPLVVPVEYRVRGDFTALSADPPELRVAVEARPGTAIVIDGKAVSLDGAGKGVYGIDISDQVKGTSDSVVAIEKKLPYAVTPPNGAVERGDVTLRVGVAPLRIDAPGPRIVVEEGQFMLSGRTAKDGTVTVAGRPITVDTEGRFSQLMNVSSVGETTITVRAAAKDLAPRMAAIDVKRVESLEDEARAFETKAVREYDAVGKNIERHKGKRVAWTGKVIEARTQQTTIALLDVESGCAAPPCLARLLYGQKRELPRDAKVRAYGEILQAVDGPQTGDEIPEIRADFILDAAKN